mmetsp:Transcript_38053/g.67119  ORF Transcript_38053/g.67119 Transcript_38053/m.67119 type:complete len:241 (-) Transcript_38053:68-790(-)
MDFSMDLQSILLWMDPAEPTSGEPDAVATTCCCPFVLDDAQMSHIVTTQARGGRNGVEARLDVWNVINQTADAWGRASELLKKLCVGVALLRVCLVILLACLGAEVLQLLLLCFICRAELQHLVEAALGPTANVKHFGEEGPSCDHLGKRHRSVRVNGSDAEDLITIQFQGIEDFLHLFGAIACPHTHGIALVVREAATSQVKLKMVNVALVAFWDCAALQSHCDSLGVVRLVGEHGCGC